MTQCYMSVWPAINVGNAWARARRTRASGGIRGGVKIGYASGSTMILRSIFNFNQRQSRLKFKILYVLVHTKRHLADSIALIRSSRHQTPSLCFLLSAVCPTIMLQDPSRVAASSNLKLLILLLIRSFRWRRCSCRCSGIIIPRHFLRCTGRPTSRACAATSPASSSPTSSAASARLTRWWSHKREVAVDGLVEELGVVGLCNCFARLRKGRVFYECVALSKFPVSANLGSRHWRNMAQFTFT